MMKKLIFILAMVFSTAVFSQNLTYVEGVARKGFTTAELNALVGKVEGDTYYDRTLKKVVTWNGSGWDFGFDWGQLVDDDIIPDGSGTRSIGSVANAFALATLENLYFTDGAAALDWRVFPNGGNLVFYEHDGSVWQPRYTMRSLGTPVASGDVATKAYVDGVASLGDAWSDPVDASIVPDTDNTKSLGETGSRFLYGFFNQIYASSLVDAGSLGLYLGEANGTSGQRWNLQKSVANLNFNYQSTAQTEATAGTYNTLYSLNSTGTPGASTDLITKAYADANYSAGSFPVTDNTSIVQNTIDLTKQLRINASQISSATTRILSVPDYDVDLGDYDAGIGGIRFGVDFNVSGKRWWLRKETTGDKLAFRVQTVAELQAGTSWSSDLYTLDESGSPVDGTDLITKAYADANYGSGSGDVVGPASATNSAIALFDGTTGKLLKNSTVSINSGSISSVQSISFSGTNANILLTPTDTEPSAAKGKIYSDNSENRPKYHDGTSWKAVLLSGDATDDQTASEVGITDAGGDYTGSTVEAAFAEIADSLAIKITSNSTPPTGWEQVTEIYSNDYSVTPSPGALPAGALGFRENMPPAVNFTGTLIPLDDYYQRDDTTDDTATWTIDASPENGASVEILINLASEPAPFSTDTGVTQISGTTDFAANTLQLLTVKVILGTVYYYYTTL